MFIYACFRTHAARPFDSLAIELKIYLQLVRMCKHITY